MVTGFETQTMMLLISSSCLDPKLFPGFKSECFEDLQNPDLQFGNWKLLHKLGSFFLLIKVELNVKHLYVFLWSTNEYLTSLVSHWIWLSVPLLFPLAEHVSTGLYNPELYIQNVEFYLTYSIHIA